MALTRTHPHSSKVNKLPGAVSPGGTSVVFSIFIYDTAWEKLTTFDDFIYIYKTTSRLALVATQFTIHWVQGTLSPGAKQLECENNNISPLLCLHGMVFNREDFYMYFCSLKDAKYFIFYFMCCGNEGALSSATYTVTSFLESQQILFSIYFGIHMPLGSPVIHTQDFSSMRLPTQSMM